MKKELLVFMLFSLIDKTAFSQKSTLENINETTRNVLDIFKPTNKKTLSNYNTNSKKEEYSEIAPNATQSNSEKKCKEFCIENNGKKNNKATIEVEETGYTNQLLVMPKDKSCLYDIPIGIYVLKIYQDEKLVKKSQIRVDDREQETITIQE